MAVDEENLHSPEPQVEMHETSPLLSTPPSPASSKVDYVRRLRTRTYFVALVLLIVINLGNIILDPATARIYEAAYCNDYYQTNDPSLLLPGGVDEIYCKIPQVQRDVSSLVGFRELFDAMPGLLLAIPFGILADKYGRKWLSVLNLFCILCRYLWVVVICLLSGTLTLRLIWFGAVFNLFGGGVMVTESLFCTILSDVTPRDKLANMFFYVNAVSFTTRMIGPIICASLMKKDIWAPVWLAVALQAIGFLVSLALPETLGTALEDTGHNATSTIERSNHHTAQEEAEDEQRPSRKTDSSIFEEGLSSLRHLAFIFADWRMAVLASLYPVRMMMSALTDLLPRYISYRYEWSLADATFLYSLQALGAAVCLFAVLPLLSDYLSGRLELSAVQKSVVLARVSIGFCALGMVLEGIAPSIPLLICALFVGTLGSGIAPALRALAGALIEQKDNGKVYTGLSVAETISQMVAYPAVTGLYNWGISKGRGAWLGLPFDVTGVILGITAIWMCYLKFEMSPRL